MEPCRPCPCLVAHQCTRKCRHASRHLLTMWPNGCARTGLRFSSVPQVVVFISYRRPHCSDHVAPSIVVRDMGILLDADVSMKSHVTRFFNWLLRAAAAAFHPSFCAAIRTTVIGGVTSPQSSGLR